MAVKTYVGTDKVFLRAWWMACGEPPASRLPPPSRRQYVKYSKQGRGMAFRHKQAAEKLVRGGK